MDKSFNGIFKQDFLECLKLSIEGHIKDNLTKKAQLPYQDNPSFYDRALEVLMKLRTAVFGINHYVTSSKTIKASTDNEFLIKALFAMDKYSSKTSVLNEHLNVFEFVSLVLEKNAPLREFEEYLFGPTGIKRDFSDIYTKEKHKMSMQCAAQILWSLEGNKIPTIEAMKRRLSDKESPLFNFLKPELFIDRETISDWIRPVFPIPVTRRRGRWRSHLFDDIVPIPNIINGDVVSFPRIHFAVYCTTSILKAFGWDIVQICESKFIKTLIPAKDFAFHFFIKAWVKEFYDSSAGLEASKF